MRWIEQFRMSMLMLFRRESQSKRLNDELAFHLDQQVKENIAKGFAPDEARYAALRTFGNPTQLRDQARSNWSWNWLEKFLRDLRYGARTLTRSPGFSLTAILVMALGIGAYHFFIYHCAFGAVEATAIPRSRQPGHGL